MNASAGSLPSDGKCGITNPGFARSVLETRDSYSSTPDAAGVDHPIEAESFERWKQRLSSRCRFALGKALLQAYQGISPALSRHSWPVNG